MKTILPKTCLFTLMFLLVSNPADAQFWKRKKKEKPQMEVKVAEAVGKKPVKTVKTKNSINYKQALNEIDSLINIDQSKTAKVKVLNLKSFARSDNQVGYYMRALALEKILIYKTGEPEESTIMQWRLLQAEFKSNEEPFRIFIAMEMAQFLKSMYMQNRWNSQRIADDSSMSPVRWSNEKLNREARNYVSLSLQLAEGYAMGSYLEPDISMDYKYDLMLDVRQMIALSAIDILGNMFVKAAVTYTAPDVKDAMSSKDEFLKKNFNQSEDPKNQYLILYLHQQVLQPYQLYFDLKRLKYVKQNYPGNEQLYVDAVESLWKKNEKDSFSNLAIIDLAWYYKDENPGKAISPIDDGLKRFPAFSQNAQLREIRDEITKPALNADFEEVNQPGKKLLAKITYNNVGKVYVRAYQIDYKEFLADVDGTYYSYSEEAKVRAMKFIKRQKLISQSLVSLPQFADYKTHSAEIAIQELPAGMHMLVLSNSANPEDSMAVIGYTRFCVSRYIVIDERGQLSLVDAYTGKSVAGLEYKVFEAGTYWRDQWKEKYELLKTGTTDQKGRIEVPDRKENNTTYVIEVAGQVIYDESYSKRNPDSPAKDELNLKILTDRVLYRPGQKVYFKAIAYMGLSKKTVSGREVTLTLKDNNGDIKDKATLKTNAYGSVSGSFILPKGGLNTGNFSISYGYETAYFGVEEYKRPKYSVSIKTPEQAYKLNDDVKISGEAMALAGYAVQGAKVSYEVNRTEKRRDWMFWFRGPSPSAYQEQLIKTGELVTGNDGKFSIEFKAIPDLQLNPEDNPYFNFTISATVTDINGEVRTVSYELTLAYSDRDIQINSQSTYLDKDKKELTFSLKNLQGKDLPFTGKIILKKVDKSGGVKRARIWPKPDTMAISQTEFAAWFQDYEQLHKKDSSHVVAEQEFMDDKSGKWMMPENIGKETGDYIAIIQTKDYRGKIIEAAAKFSVEPSVEGPYKENNGLKIIQLNGPKLEPGQTARILIAGSGKSFARILIKSRRGTILEKEMEIASNAQLIEFPVLPADRGNIIIYATAVGSYTYHDEVSTLIVPYSNKELDIKLSSFRDQLEPGSAEKWTITLKGPASEVAAMETLAAMYDESLDALYYNGTWNFASEIYYGFDFYNVRDYAFGWNHLKSLKDAVNIAYPYEELSYPLFNNSTAYVGQRSFQGMAGLAGGSVKRKNGDNANFKISRQLDFDGFANKVSFQADGDDVDHMKEREASPEQKNAAPTVRKNFNETAFFLPHLYANAKGEIKIEFTMPESLTKWKMMMLAHSTTMQLGYNEQSVTTSKKVMVQPNMPRFLRQGDAISIAAKIINTTNEAIASRVSIKITDEATGKELDWLADKNDKSISVPAGGNVACSFKLNIPDYTGVVNVAIYATAGSYSDGEQNTLLVLSNRNLVTETMPITVRKAGMQKLEFKHLKNNTSTSLQHEKFSVEMSSNPAWYAIQALPYMMEYPHECAEQVFTRLYANSIAAHIANSDPAIKKIYEIWAKEAANGTGLQSKLMQNQDLKTTMIEETPWLAEAKDETERMKKFGILFNREKMHEEINSAFSKLKDMQSGNGAWPWFKGMSENGYITQTIVIGFGKMKKMGIDISAYETMVNTAIKYMDDQARRDYLHYMSLKKEQGDFYPTNLQYLYCKSYFPAIGLTDTSRVLQYFINNAEKNWSSNSLLNKAQLATALHILKPSSAVPQLIIRGMNENAKQTDEMGMYWPNNTGGWYWYEAPVETQAAIIEAYKTLGTDQAAIREQQIWLLRQKQTQAWKTTRSTADACYVLLMGGQLLSNKQNITVTVKDKVLSPEKKQAGTGYFRQDIPKNEIGSGTGNIVVNAATSDFAYGAVYWQYFENLDKIQSTGSGLTITKRLYKIIHTAKGEEKQEVKTGNVLHVGDMIEVSLNISSDRNLEFVHIKDQRASGAEPADVLSVYHWQNGLGYYQSTRDASTNFFVDNMSKGHYQLNYILKVEQAGVFNGGVATAQCMYAPEYAANSTTLILKVE